MEYARSMWDCLTSMCSCLRCAEDIGNAGQGLETNERTHLLIDPINQSPAIRRNNSDDFTNDYSQSLPKKDDQNALSRLVQNTAINMINVGAMDSHNLEQREYNVRIKQYSKRLQQQWNNVQHPGIAPKGLLKDIPNPHYYMSKPASKDDSIQVKRFIQKSINGVMDIKIDHKEAIVVPFRIP